MMGYAFYTNRHGRECGYGVEATCDHAGCTEIIDLGYDYLCGPPSVIHAEGAGCGGYFCPGHRQWVRETLDGEFVSLCERCKDDPELDRFFKPDDEDGDEEDGRP
jgi:hypothetical protein